MVPYGRYKNLLLITRPKEHFFFTGVEREYAVQKRFPLKLTFPPPLFSSISVGNLLDRIFAFDANEGKYSLGRVIISKFL